jgi:hypothetical protein
VYVREITLERKYVYAAALCFLVAVAALLVLYNNLSSVDATLGSAVVSHVGLHRAEGAQTYFLLVVTVKNPSRVPVTMSFEEITFRINGTEYPSVDLGSNPVTLGPRETRGIERLVLVTGSPVGFQEEGTERYLLETIWVLKGTTRSLGLQSSGRKTLENTTGWWYQIGS